MYKQNNLNKYINYLYFLYLNILKLFKYLKQKNYFLFFFVIKYKFIWPYIILKINYYMLLKFPMSNNFIIIK